MKVDEMSGADPKKLEEKIIQWIGDSDSEAGVKGYVSHGVLKKLIVHVHSWHLNETADLGKLIWRMLCTNNMQS